MSATCLRLKTWPEASNLSALVAPGARLQMAHKRMTIASDEPPRVQPDRVVARSAPKTAKRNRRIKQPAAVPDRVIMTLHLVILLVIKLTLAALILSVGMDATFSDLSSLFRQPLRLLKAVLAVNVIVPLAAGILISLFPLMPAVRLGIMVMAVSPVPPLVPGKELKTGGDKTYAFSLYTALVLLSIVIVPVTVAVVAQIYGRSVTLGPLAVARNVVTGALLPLLAGVLIHRAAPILSERLSPLIRKLAMILLILAVIPLLGFIWPGIQALIGNGTIIAMALTALIALTAGHLLGGPKSGDRGALAMAAATRHPGIALMIANAAGADRLVTAAIVTFMLVGLIVAIPYQIWLKRTATRAGAAVSGPAARGQGARAR